MGRAVRNHSAMSLVMLDVDFFKRYNDRFGHQTGDDCLRRVAHSLRTSLMRPAITLRATVVRVCLSIAGNRFCWRHATC